MLMQKITKNPEEYRKALMDAIKVGYRLANAYRQKDGTLRVVFVESKAMQGLADNDA